MTIPNKFINLNKNFFLKKLYKKKKERKKVKKAEEKADKIFTRIPLIILACLVPVF